MKSWELLDVGMGKEKEARVTVCTVRKQER